ncbi:hypothetical protein BASA61_004322 [Batrachochytrium salamandrivorans]|nr:hypothetical protein BASA61_004322 [Batrachochytrium salamandrivorans]
MVLHNNRAEPQCLERILVQSNQVSSSEKQQKQIIESSPDKMILGDVSAILLSPLVGTRLHRRNASPGPSVPSKRRLESPA